MLTVITWRWEAPGGVHFGPEYVNRLRSMLERNLQLPHELVCVTDDRMGIDKRVRIVVPPRPLPGDMRCRRRMWQYAAERRHDLGERILAIDLDVVIVRDITPIVDRPEPLVCWRVGYANVFSGSFVLFDAGALDGAWRAYAADPLFYPALTGEKNASDQAMLNQFLKHKQVAQWKERDGFVTWFGSERYKHLQHHGMGPDRPNLPPHARIVVLGSADKGVMDAGRYPFVREHWR